MNLSPTLHTSNVNLAGLMTVLGEHLYSTPLVALRELVQNAHDSILRRRLDDPAFSAEGASIRVSADIARQIVTITDTGSGLTEREIHDYLATVGVGYTRLLRQREGARDELIGMFGLGFLSAFGIARSVTLTTCSYQEPEKGWCYQSNNAQQYVVTEVAPGAVGTTVELDLREEFGKLSGDDYLARVLGRYCALLRVPVFVGARTTPLNAERPPWQADPSQPAAHPLQARKRRLEFAARFEQRFTPLCTMPVEGDDLRGLLWVQDGGSYGNSDNRNLSVFLRGMLLDDDARDLLPGWAGFMGGVVESDRLLPTASREALQRNDAYRAARHAIGEAAVSGLAAIARSEPEVWRRILERHNEALLGAALCDDRLFELLADEVRIPSSQGDLRARLLRHDGMVHVGFSTGGFEDMLFRMLGVAVADGDRYAVLPFLRQWASRHNTRVIEIGTEKGNRVLFSEEAIAPARLELLTRLLGDGEQVIAARFLPVELPLVVVPDREAELKRRLESDEADKRISMTALRLVRNFTAGIDGSVRSRLYVNLDNPAIAALLAAGEGEAAGRAGALLKAIKQLLNTAQDRDEQPDLRVALSTIGEAALALMGQGDRG
ncbi:MAG: ATP-binding protein [Alphaproteobacteria bacterium]|nr:ATP-binding protein [Alphaproteobacteria bacterium]